MGTLAHWRFVEDPYVQRHPQGLWVGGAHLQAAALQQQLPLGREAVGLVRRPQALAHDGREAPALHDDLASNSITRCCLSGKLLQDGAIAAAVTCAPDVRT